MKEYQNRICRYSNAPDIEVYLNVDPEHAKYEVWIPVTKNIWVDKL